MARTLLRVVVFLNALAMCGGLLLASLGWIGGGNGGYDEYAFLNRYIAMAGVALLIVTAILTAPAVLALRWQRAPPASRRSAGAVALLALATLVNVALGLGWIVSVVYFAVTAQPAMALGLVGPVFFPLAPDAFALIAAWSWRPWARQPGKPLRWTPRASDPAPPPARRGEGDEERLTTVTGARPAR